jgi:hypothetical protein
MSFWRESWREPVGQQTARQPTFFLSYLEKKKKIDISFEHLDGKMQGCLMSGWTFSQFQLNKSALLTLVVIISCF